MTYADDDTLPRWPEPLAALFVSPHADDVELFCGGTVARLAAAGYAVGIADLTRGELASNGSPQQRREESLTAARALGALLPRPVVGLPDGGIEPADPAQVRAVVEMLRAARPRALFLPWRQDRHPDHEAANRLLHRASFLAGLPRYEAEGGPHRAAVVLYYPCHHPVEPSLLVDVSPYVGARRAALAAYRSQFARGEGDVQTYINRSGFQDGIEARFSAWGSRIGVAFAEGFVSETPLRIDDPIAVLDPPSGEPR